MTGTSWLVIPLPVAIRNLLKADSVGNVVWAKTYKANGNEYFNRMKPTFDGGYIAVGTVTNTETAARDMWLVKTNDTGKVVWSKRLGFNTANGEVGQDVIQQTDSSYAFIGKTNFYGSFTDGMIGVVSAEGSTQWIKQFGYNNGDDGYSLVQNGDKLVAFGCTCYLSYFNSVHKTQQEGDTCCNLFPAKWLKGIYASKCHRNGKSRGSTC